MKIEQRDQVTAKLDRLLLNSHDIATLLPETIRTVCEHLGWSLGIYWAFDQEQGVLSFGTRQPTKLWISRKYLLLLQVRSYLLRYIYKALPAPLKARAWFAGCVRTKRALKRGFGIEFQDLDDLNAKRLFEIVEANNPKAFIPKQ